MITDVSHSIQAGSFQTTFDGVRQGFFDLPTIDSLLQSINQNLVTKLEEILKINKDQVKTSATTNNVKSTEVVQAADNTLDTTNSCSSKITAGTYTNAIPGYVAVNGTLTEVTPTDFATALNRLLPNEPDLRTFIYCISYIRTFQETSNTKEGTFNGWNNNLGTLSLSVDWKGQVQLFPRVYSCVNIRTNPSTSSSQPIIHFESLDNYITFMAGRLRANVDRVIRLGLAKYYVCHWPTDNISEQYFDDNINEFNQTIETFTNALSSAGSVGLSSVDKFLEYKQTMDEGKNNSNTPEVTPTPVPPNEGQTCPPPVVSTFSPSAGYTGTIVQVNGRNFESVKSITVAGQNVDINNITVFNTETLRFILPAITIPEGQDVATGRIIVTTEYGTSGSSVNFTFNPALKNTITSSPGGNADTTTQQQPTVSQQDRLGENINPQQTGPLTMIETAVQLNASKTQSLNVKINPELTDWVLGTTVDMNYQVYELQELNNQVTRKSISQSLLKLGGQVTNGEFNITLPQVESYLSNNIPKIEGKTQIDIVFGLLSYKGKESPVRQQFPFRLWYTLPNQNQVPLENVPVNQTLPTFPQQQLSIIKLPDSDAIRGEGNSYYNIKKLAGGYIPFDFTLPSGQIFNSQNISSINILDSSYNNVSFGSVLGPDTKYTNEVTINSKGVFRLQIQYRPYGFTSPIGGEVLVQTVLSDTFTL
jgi:hypothetical protein